MGFLCSPTNQWGKVVLVSAIDQHKHVICSCGSVPSCTSLPAAFAKLTKFYDLSTVLQCIPGSSAMSDRAHQQDQVGKPSASPWAPEPDQDNTGTEWAPETFAGAEAAAGQRTELCQRPEDAERGKAEKIVQTARTRSGGGRGSFCRAWCRD